MSDGIYRRENSKWRASVKINENIHGLCENTAGLWRWKSLDLDSACSKEVSYVKIFQFHNVLNESERYRATANGLHTEANNGLSIQILDVVELYLYV